MNPRACFFYRIHIAMQWYSIEGPKSIRVRSTEQYPFPRRYFMGRTIPCHINYNNGIHFNALYMQFYQCFTQAYQKYYATTDTPGVL